MSADDDDLNLYFASEAEANSFNANFAARSLAHSSVVSRCQKHWVVKRFCSSTILVRTSVTLSLFFAYVWIRADSMSYLSTIISSTCTWLYLHPEEVLLRFFSQLRLERLLVTAAMTWFTTYLATHWTSEASILSEFANRISLRVNFLTQDSTTGLFELDWVTVSEEAPVLSTTFRNVLSKARKRAPALAEKCPLLCPLSMRGLLPGDLSDLMMWNTLSSYASSKLINNLGINHTLAGLPVKVSDVVMTLTFERDNKVGRNPLGKKMRLLIISKEDLLGVYENWKRKQQKQELFLRTKTGTKWSHMRLAQLEELAQHFCEQPMSDRTFDKTRCYGLLRLYTPMVTMPNVVGTTQQESKSQGEGGALAASMLRHPSRPVWTSMRRAVRGNVHGT